MAGNAREITDLIRMLAGTHDADAVIFIEATIKSVDKDTCVVLPVDGKISGEIEGVRLSTADNDGVKITPSKDSLVLVAITAKQGAYVLLTSDIDKYELIIDKDNKFTFSKDGWVWNDGKLGGMVKLNDVVGRLNKIEQKVNTIIAAFSSSPIAPTDGGAAYKAGLISAVGAALTPTKAKDIENLKIKQ
jgi:hypothetical protein